MGFMEKALRGMGAITTGGLSEVALGAAKGDSMGDIGKNIGSSFAKGFSGGTVDPDKYAEDGIGAGLIDSGIKGLQLGGTLAGGAGLAGGLGGGAASAGSGAGTDALSGMVGQGIQPEQALASSAPPMSNPTQMGFEQGALASDVPMGTMPQASTEPLSQATTDYFNSPFDPAKGAPGLDNEYQMAVGHGVQDPMALGHMSGAPDAGYAPYGSPQAPTEQPGFLDSLSFNDYLRIAGTAGSIGSNIYDRLQKPEQQFRRGGNVRSRFRL